jgi:hypothetical protein
MIYVLLAVAISLIVIRSLLWRYLLKIKSWTRQHPGEAYKTVDRPIEDVLSTIMGVLDIVFPALLSVFLYLHLNNGALYVEAAEAIIGIVLSAAISIFNIILTITGGARSAGKTG